MTPNLRRALEAFVPNEQRRARCPVCHALGDEPCVARRRGITFDAWALQRWHPARVRVRRVGCGVAP